MKKIFILFAVAFIGFASCVESKQVMTVTVTNPLGLERAGEMIEVPMKRCRCQVEAGRYSANCGA